MLKVETSYKVDWHSVREGEFPTGPTFYPLWIVTDTGIKLHHYDPNTDEPNVQGFLLGGEVFEQVTHWAYLLLPEMPE